MPVERRTRVLTYTLKRWCLEYNLQPLLSSETISHPTSFFFSFLPSLPSSSSDHLQSLHRSLFRLSTKVQRHSEWVQCVRVCVFHHTELIGCATSEGESQLTLTSPLCFSPSPAETLPSPVSACLLSFGWAGGS